MVFRIVTFLIILSAGLNVLQAQDEDFSLQEREYQLECLAQTMMNARDGAERVSSIQHFQRLFVEALEQPEACKYPFMRLRDYVSMLAPKDSSFRLFTWSKRYYADSFEFGGVIQLKNTNECEVIVLLDKSPQQKKEDEHGLMTAENWRGALYYQLFQVGKKKDKYYILLGWDGTTRASNKKIIEPLTFDANGMVTFGKPVFMMKEGSPLKSRVVFEFADKAVMSLRHEPSKNVIVWEHLSPPNSRATGQYSLYLPDGTYDYLELKKGIWIKREMLFEKFSIPTNMDDKDIKQP